MGNVRAKFYSILLNLRRTSALSDIYSDSIGFLVSYGVKHDTKGYSDCYEICTHQLLGDAISHTNTFYTPGPRPNRTSHRRLPIGYSHIFTPFNNRPIHNSQITNPWTPVYQFDPASHSSCPLQLMTVLTESSSQDYLGKAIPA